MQCLHSPPLTLTSPNIPKSQLDSTFSFSPPENPFSHALLTLRACAAAKPEDAKTGPSAHARMVKSGLDADVFIGNSLIDMYSKIDRLDDARNVFDYMPQRTVVSWTSIMSAYNRHGLPHETILLFSRMLECENVQPNEFTLAVLLQACALRCDGDLVEIVQCRVVKTGFLADGFLQNSLVDAFVKSGMLAGAEKLVLGMAKRDVVSWTSVISGWVSSRGNKAERAVELFCRMLEYGVSPNDVTMVAVLKACSVIGSFEIMRWVHGLVVKGNWCVNSLVLNSLMEMYSVNEYLFESVNTFCRFSFNKDGRYPCVETMANLLQGCGIYGELKLGEEIHGFLIKHGFLPCTVVENSLINMYAKNGLTNSALLIFMKMVDRDIISWNTIMNCLVKNGDPSRALTLLRQIHREAGNLRITERVAKELSALEPESGAWRVALSNAFAAAGEWRHVAAIRAEMRESGWGKEGGWSSVNVDGFEFRFMAGKTECLESRVIYDVVGRLGNHVRDA
ncbi:Unknown protein [Striga hermonthica]|uniref:Chlororespiratory reduction 4 n=1 Tax=Striga hermonthica TaxID=68872 RepID=A0A9N7NX76_STRHE|nr:Unknown protein [Striga hermonthica]